MGIVLTGIKCADLWWNYLFQSIQFKLSESPATVAATHPFRSVAVELLSGGIILQGQ